MMRLMRHNELLRSATFIVLMLGLLFRASIPAGWMPGSTAGELWDLSICNPQGNSLDASADEQSGGRDAPFDAHQAHDLCPFVGQGHLSIPIAILGALPRAGTSCSKILDGSDVAAFIRPIGPPLGSRAPPAFA